MNNGIMRAMKRGLAMYGVNSLAESNPAAAARIMSDIMNDDDALK